MGETNQFGHYKVHSEIGRGGMAIVYKCWEESLQRFVALKVLSPHLAKDEDIKQRFFREAQSMAAISHPNVINVHFIGEENGLPFFAMEFIEGQSLSQILKDNRALDVRHACNILHQACEGLRAAHDSGLIHRDIKPGNILISENGYLKLLDFGIAFSKDFDSTLTQTGEVVGTPGYLSPEICTGDPVDNRSDIYSLGIVFYQMLAGDVPFDTSTPYKLLKDIVESDIANIQEINEKVDDKTAGILLKMIDKNPANRYQNCQDLLDDLGEVEKNSELLEIIQKSRVNTQAERTIELSFQVTQITQPGLIHKYKKGLGLLAMLLILIFSGLVYHFYPFKTSQQQDINSNLQVSVQGDSKNQPQSKEDPLTKFIKDRELDKVPMPEETNSENMNEESTAGQKTVVSQKPEKCLEVAKVTILNQEEGRWFSKKSDTPEDELLELIRNQLLKDLAKDSALKNHFKQYKPMCDSESHNYKLSLMITDYKENTKQLKLISKMGIGKEKTSLILTMTDMKTSTPLGNKEIEVKGISEQLKSGQPDYEFYQIIHGFLIQSLQ